MASGIRKLCVQLVALSKAPTLSEEYLGPALFVGPAAGELFGEVLRENRPMVEMCGALGFAIAPDPEDAAVVRVCKRLAAE